LQHANKNPHNKSVDCLAVRNMRQVVRNRVRITSARSA